MAGRALTRPRGYGPFVASCALTTVLNDTKTRRRGASRARTGLRNEKHQMWHSPWCIGMAHGLNADEVGDTPRSSGISGKYWHEPPRTSLFVRSYCQGRSVPLRRYCAGRNELLSSISAVVRQRTCGEAFRGRLSAYLSWSNRWMGKRARGSVKLLTRPACSVFTPDRVLFVCWPATREPAMQ